MGKDRKKRALKDMTEEEIRSQVEYFHGLVKKSMAMNTKQEITGDLQKMEFLLEYMEILKKYGQAYFRAVTEGILRKQSDGKWFVLPSDRSAFAKQMYRVTRTRAVSETIEKKLFKEKSLDPFYHYCALIQKQVDKLYAKYFRSCLYRKGDMVCSRICGTWDPKNRFWYIIVNDKRKIYEGFPKP